MNTFLTFRKNIIIWLFKNSQKFYVSYFKKSRKAWNISKQELLNYPNGSLGNSLGLFLKANNFEVMPKLERHDCYHLITSYQTKVEDEIALQYLCFGNGKKSLYLYGVLIVGTLILPDYIKYYLKSYRIGKNVNLFYQLDFQKMLGINLNKIQSFIFTKKQITNILNTI